MNLLEQGELLRQDEFIVWQGRKKCSRRVFLFEDLVLFSKTRRRASGTDCYVYKNCFKVRLFTLWTDLGIFSRGRFPSFLVLPFPFSPSLFRFQFFFLRTLESLFLVYFLFIPAHLLCMFLSPSFPHFFFISCPSHARSWSSVVHCQLPTLQSPATKRVWCILSQNLNCLAQYDDLLLR